MMFSPSRIFLVITVIGVGLAALFLLTPNRGRQNAPLNQTIVPPKQTSDTGNLPSNAFLPPSRQEEIPPLPVQQVAPPQPLSDAPSIPEFTDLSELEEIIMPERIVPFKETELLPFPEVGRNELTIDSNGISNVAEYSLFLATNAKDINFDYQKFNTVLKDKYGIALMPVPLVEKALKENDFNLIRDSIPVLQEFMSAHVAFQKTIRTKEEMIQAIQASIGFGELTRELLKKAGEVSRNTLLRADFEVFYEKYKNTVRFYNQKLRKQYGDFSFRQKEHPLYAFLDVFGLGKIARAQISWMGGKWKVIWFCTCNPDLGRIVQVIGQVPSPPLYTNAAIDASILLVGTMPGAWVLGAYVPISPLPCFQLPTPCVNVASASQVPVTSGITWSAPP